MKKSEKLANVLQSDRLFSLSSGGTGLAAMFPPFQAKLGLPRVWLYGIDSVLALSVIICIICLSYHAGWMYEKYKGLELAELKDLELVGRKDFERIERLEYQGNTKFGKIVAVFLALCGVIGGIYSGIYYIGLACKLQGIYCTTIVLGYVLFGASLLICIKMLDRFFNKTLD